MKNNGFYLRRVGNEAWLMMRGDYPVDESCGEKAYVYPVKLNETGAYIWGMLDGGSSPENIAGNIQDIYGISYEEALADVTALTEDFIKRGFIKD